MTPKEKAKELVNCFYQPLGHLKCGVSSGQMWGYAKSSALVVVKECYDESDRQGTKISLIRQGYLNEVKTEIEKL